MFNPCNNQSAIGNLVKTPELKQWASGTLFCDFTLGINRPGEDAGTDFVRCRLKGKAAQALVQYGTPGRLIAVAGSHRQETVEHAGKAFHVSHLETVGFKFLDKKPATAEAEAEVAGDVPWDEDDAPVAKVTKPAAKAAKPQPTTKTAVKAVPVPTPVGKAARPAVVQAAPVPVKAGKQKVKVVSFSDDDIPA
jgi:single-stranded DNA-binding protein